MQVSAALARGRGETTESARLCGLVGHLYKGPVPRHLRDSIFIAAMANLIAARGVGHNGRHVDRYAPRICTTVPGGGASTFAVDQRRLQPCRAAFRLPSGETVKVQRGRG